MDTPICDFVNKYHKSNTLRLHMPGHKGKPKMGIESYDITEVSGADSLYEATGIIRKSELNAGSLFGADTFYSTEGSSLCIRAMLYLTLLYAKGCGKQPIIAAGRNVHKSFLSGAALLDLDVQWIYGEEKESYLSCTITPEIINQMLVTSDCKPVAVYITSPDYLGNISDVKGISQVCRKHGVLLIVDNAHGAYLKFLPKSQHPIDLGADICCDSAHKTLPVLTGGAYLHISLSAPQIFKKNAKYALSLFASTSPSYLILQSLDMVNSYLSDSYEKKLKSFTEKIQSMKKRLLCRGFILCGNEPMKLTINSKAYGYTGTELANELAHHNVICEFCDPDYIVFMFTPEIGETGLDTLENALSNISKKDVLAINPPVVHRGEYVMSARKAMFSPKEELPLNECVGKILATVNVSCPPAVPIIVCGEKIDESAVKCMKYYGVDKCWVISS